MAEDGSALVTLGSFIMMGFLRLSTGKRTLSNCSTVNLSHMVVWSLFFKTAPIIENIC